MEYISLILVIFLIIALYYIWQLTIEKKIRFLEENNNLTQRLDAINHKLGLIDRLNNNIDNLQQIFGSKQHRGLYGEHKLLDILKDELTAGQYNSQYILANNTRPDIVLNLATQPSLLAIDAKFPYEAFKAIKENEIKDKLYEAAQLKAFINDIKKHIKDVSNKYIIAGQTQDFALLFIPAESIFTYIMEHGAEIQTFAAANKVILCTPNILMLIIRIVKSLNKDYQMQLHARAIQDEVMKMAEDIQKLNIRNKKLQRHFSQAIEDLEIIDKTTNKIDHQITKIHNIDSNGYINT